MSMRKLALSNFKNSFKSYLSLVVSMAFTILIFLNFQTLLDSDLFLALGEHNKEYIDIVIQVISFVLGCFMFFFLQYATNVFLTKRKKEIGIYIFMGLSNQKIGRLYMAETVLTGLSALVFGTVSGVLTTQLFQMILLAIADIDAKVSFRLYGRPLLAVSGIFLAMYFVFAVKGYVNIVRSSVLDMVSASRLNEYVRQNDFALAVKTVSGIAVLSAGYYLAVKEGGQEVMGNVLAAVVLVVIGVYLLFGGFLPMLFQNLSKKKLFLYKKQRTLWINNVIFRMKKNYRAYAMTSVMMICSVTALATGFAMKARYQSIVHFRNTYSFQFMSARTDLDGTIRKLIEKDNDIAYGGQIPMLALDASLVRSQLSYSSYGVFSVSNLKELAGSAGMEFEMERPGDDEVVALRHLYMLSLLTDRSNQTVGINGKTYRQIQETNVPYLGYFQEMTDFYVVSDAEYQRLLPLGEEMRLYNYALEDRYNYEASVDDLEALSGGTGESQVARVTVDPNSGDIEWVKVLYTVCIFLFLVFVLASASILFMKLYNDAFEERERYRVLKKIGMSERALRKSVSCELGTAYVLPFLVTAVSSYFSVRALEQMMYADLTPVYLASVAVIFVIFFFCYLFSIPVFAANCGILSRKA